MGVKQDITKFVNHILAVSQHMTLTHGQGRVNRALLVELHSRGYDINAICSWIDGVVAPPFRVHIVSVPKYLPTNWLRCELFMRRARRVAANIGEITINNGAAVIAPSEVNIANFVHAAWWRSPMHPRHQTDSEIGKCRRTYQSLHTWYNIRAEKRAYGLARQVVAISNIVREELIQLVGLAESKISVIMNGVDCVEFKPSERHEANQFRQYVGTTLDKVVALFAGDIRTTRKNLDLVLHAITRLPPEIELWVAGSTDGSPYPAIAERLGIASRVRWLGHRTDMPLVMRSADMFLFPSHYEPFGLVVLEALASGLPVITTKQTGAADAVRGEAGLVLKDGSDLDAMLERVRAWLSDRARLMAAKRAARAEAETRTWAAMGKQYADLIERIRSERVATP